MKDIIEGKRRFFRISEIQYVSVPFYDELKPENVIKKMNIKASAKLLEYLPELSERDAPKDQEFFFNIVNTIWPNSVEGIVF